VIKRISKRLGVALIVLVSLGVIFILVQGNRRPAIGPYALLELPPAPTTSSIKVQFAGVSTLLFDDGETALMIDGFFSRPAALKTLAGTIEPDHAAIQRNLERLNVRKLAAVIPAHSHYDHAMDSPLVALQTGAVLIGSESTLNIGRGLGMKEDRMRKVAPNDVVALGKWKLTFITSGHAPTPFNRSDKIETIDKPLVPPMRATAWREGQTWAILIEHLNGASMLVNGSAGFIENSLAGRRADVVFLGIGTAGKQPQTYRAQLWKEVVQRVGARQVIPIHWDDFWKPLDKPLAAMPSIADDMSVTMTDFEQWAKRDGVTLKMAPLFRPFDPRPPQ
jgi:L-ascorbate metabolism protein UlaG (beta-lactamase superfamily)